MPVIRLKRPCVRLILLCNTRVGLTSFFFLQLKLLYAGVPRINARNVRIKSIYLSSSPLDTHSLIRLITFQLSSKRAAWVFLLRSRISWYRFSFAELKLQCNKITCSHCGTISCYLCRQIIKDYSHFDVSYPFCLVHLSKLRYTCKLTIWFYLSARWRWATDDKREE